MRGDKTDIEPIYHIHVPLSGTKIRFYFPFKNHWNYFPNECIDVEREELYKNKPRITYLFIPANIYLLLALYQHISAIVTHVRIQSDAIFVLTVGQKRYHRDNFVNSL